MSFISDPFGLIVQRVADELSKHIPIGPGWFSQTALKSGLLSEILAAVTTQIGDWLACIKDAQDGTYLVDATGQALQNWRLDLRLSSIVGETDSALVVRIQNEIVRLRVVQAGIENYIQASTGLATTALLPWQSVDFRGQRNGSLPQGAIDPVYGRSGSRRRESFYWQGAVIDIQTLGYSGAVPALAAQVVAAGVFCYFTALLEPEIDLDWGTVIPLEETYLEMESIPAGVYFSMDRSSSGFRSGSAAYVPLGDELLTDEQFVAVYNPLYNEPAAGKSFEVFDNPFLWSELQDLTWDQALVDIAWRLPASDTTISH